MEAELLAGVIQTDTHKRLQIAEQLIEHFKKEDVFDDFPDIESLVGGLSSWVGSSNFKVSVSGMQIMEVIVAALKGNFRIYLPTILPSLRERLGDAKDQVREQAQHLIQTLLTECVSSPQAFLDKLLEPCLGHKNWRVKEQGLLCLSRTLSYFGSGQISVSKFMGGICSLLGDANSQVRSGAMETIVEVYRHVGVKVRIDLSKRGLPSARMGQLTARFNAVDATTGNHLSDDEDDGAESVSSCGSNASARTHGSTRSAGSRNPPRPSSVARVAATGSGTISEADFEKAFSTHSRLNLYTQHDVEKTLSTINSTLVTTSNTWNQRVSALKDLRAVADQEIIDHPHFVMLLKGLETALTESLKDLRSQITREACVSLSYLCVVLGAVVAPFAASMLPQLFALLPNSAKVMATSAEICVQFIFKHSPSQKIFNYISSHGVTSKSVVTRRYSSEFLITSVSSFDTSLMNRVLPLIEELFQLAMKDADAVVRKNGRRAFWAYHDKFPSQGRRLMDSLDTQTQKHLDDEKNAILNPSSSGVLQSRSRALMVPTFSDTDLQNSNRAASPSSPDHTPSIRLIRPTLRHRPSSTKGLRSATSMDNMYDSSERASPAPRPPSRSGSKGIPRPSSRTAVRPASRTGVRPSSRTGVARADAKSVPSHRRQRISRSAQPSPAHSREGSPSNAGHGYHGTASLSRRVMPLTADSLKKLCGGEGREEEDDVASINSDHSALSFSSEVSINPYTKYTQPVQDLNELLGMCSSQQWSERRDGMAQLHLLLESSRPFTLADMEKVKAVFKRMFQEPHAKVYGMFLDTLSRFIQEHGEYLEDWLFILLLKLLQRAGTDMLSSVLFKLQMVLEHVRKAFDPESQFTVLCRIFIDPKQTLNNKVKLAFLEYLLELLPMLEPSEFKESPEIRLALSKIVKFTGEPKSADIRRHSQKAIIRLFDLNPTNLSLMLRTLPKPDQDNANKILSTYVSELPSSGDESDRDTAATPRAKKTTPTPKAKERFHSKTPSSHSRRVDPPASLPPSGPRGLHKTISSSSPNMYSDPTKSLPARSRLPTPSGGRTTPSLIPTPHRGPPRPMSTTPRASPATAFRGSPRVRPPPRSASVGPEKLAQQLTSSSNFKNTALRVARPGSSRDEYTPSFYQNGKDSGSPTSVERFSFSDLPNLDFGSPDEDEGEPDDDVEKDHMTLVVKELQASSTSKQRLNALQSLYTLSREFPERCKWEEQFKAVLLRLVEVIVDPDSAVKILVLRILREMLKTEQARLRDYAELTTMKVLKAFTDEESTVSQAAEDVFPLLAPSLPSDSALDLLAPMAITEKHPMLLGIIKLLTKVAGLVDTECLRMRLGAVVPGVIRGYSHSESSVRKASVFCLVAIHAVVGDAIREHLQKLSSSQTKLLDLYIKRHHQEASKK